MKKYKGDVNISFTNLIGHILVEAVKYTDKENAHDTSTALLDGLCRGICFVMSTFTDINDKKNMDYNIDVLIKVLRELLEEAAIRKKEITH